MASYAPASREASLKSISAPLVLVCDTSAVRFYSRGKSSWCCTVAAAAAVPLLYCAGFCVSKEARVGIVQVVVFKLARPHNTHAHKFAAVTKRT